MADPKKPTTSTAPTVAAPTVAAPKPTVPPAPPAGEAAKPKKEKKVWQSVFPTADEAVKEANGREKGPRRAFKVIFGDKTFYVVANNEGRAGGIGFDKIGGKVEELGKEKKAKKEATVDSILSALEAMPEDQRKAIEEALAKLKK